MELLCSDKCSLRVLFIGLVLLLLLILTLVDWPYNLFLVFVRYIHNCNTGRLEVAEIECGGEEPAVV